MKSCCGSIDDGAEKFELNKFMALPPLGNLVIPGVAAGIARVQRSLALQPKTTPAAFLAQVGDRKHRYVSPCQTRDGATIAFYARLHANRDAQTKFLTEIRFLRHLGRGHLSLGDRVPKLLGWGRTPTFEWFTREYPPAPPLGSSRKLTGELSTTLATKLGQSVAQIARIPEAGLPFGVRRFHPEDYNVSAALTSARISPQTIARLRQRFLSARPLLTKTNHTVAHGDLNLGNILAHGDDFWIIDWEQVHANNFAYDIGYLWAHLWQGPHAGRRALLAGFLRALPARQHPTFQRLLPLVVAYLAVGGVSWRASRTEQLREQAARRRYYRKLLDRCAGPFMTLIKT